MANYRLRQTGQEVQDLLDKIEQSKIEDGTVTIGDESLTPVSSEELQQGLAGKQDVISDLSAIREGATLGETAYQKPSDGIAKEDLVSSVQASLEKADSAIQSETDPTVPAWAKQPEKPSYALAELQDDVTHRTVTDAEKADWNGKQDAIDDLDDIRSGAGAGASAVQPSQMQTALAGKQDTLVSGQNIKTVNGESLLGPGNIEVLGGGVVEITYSDLVALRDNSNLVPGTLYRITDYVATTVTADTRSANHPFDIIVQALSESTLSEQARAALHSGDTYFENSDLEAWSVYYTVDNDSTRFAWADPDNGKGVVYRLIDEWENDVPYDFKGIQFKRFYVSGVSAAYTDALSPLVGLPIGLSTSRGLVVGNDYKWYYTFSDVGDNWTDDVTDGSFDGKHVQRNRIASNQYDSSGICRLNNNVFAGGKALYDFMISIDPDVNLEEYFTFYDNIFDGESVINNTVFGYMCLSHAYSAFRRNTVVGMLRHCRFGTTTDTNTIYATKDFAFFSTKERFGNNVIRVKSLGRCSFGTYFEGNYMFISGQCSTNSFGDSFQNNTIIVDSFGVNSIGSYFHDNTLRATVVTNTRIGDSVYKNTITDAEIRSCQFDGQLNECDLSGNFTACSFGSITSNLAIVGGTNGMRFAGVDIVGGVRGSSGNKIRIESAYFLLDSVSGVTRRITLRGDADGNLVATWMDDGVLTGIQKAPSDADWSPLPSISVNAVEYVEQTLTDAQKTQARTNIGAGTYSKSGNGIPETDLAQAVVDKLNAEEIFIATYGTTTQAQVQAAASAGKVVVCFYGSRMYVYAGESAAGYSQFTSVLYDKAYRVYLKNSSWGSASYDLPIDAVLYTTQNLSDSQKSVARGNIGAGTYSKPDDGIPGSDIAEGVIPDVSQFVTATVNNLVNYYTKSQTYTKDEVAALIGAIQQFHYEIVATLPASGESNVLYLLGPTGSGADKYEEYVYANSTWTKIGDTSIDLSGYVTTTALNTALADYTTTANLTTLLAGKQDTINDLADIRSGAAAGATAYQKPSGGIPKSDLASAVQTSLGKADTALQSFTETDPIFTASPAHGITSSDITAWNGKYTKPTNGIPATDLADGVIPEAVAAQELSIDSTPTANSTNLVTSGGVASAIAVKYTKPAGGIPASDLATGVIPSVPVQDVEVDGVSVLNNGVAEIPAIPSTYAGSPSAGGPANKTLAIPFGAVDAGSTATAITATVDNFPTTLTDGVCAYIRNDVVASASGWTLNINGTGAKPVYASNADASRTTTVFSAASTFLFVYNSSRVSGGCWDIYYGYDSNTNTVGYVLRTNSMSLPVNGATGRYRLLFTSPDGTHFVPANTSSSTNATTARAVNQSKIDPFGSIRYYSYTTVLSAGGRPGAGYLCEQNTLTLGYSFNPAGGTLKLTTWAPVYLKCAPQTDGSAIMDATEPIVQALPSTEDGKIYIFLGVAYSETAMELVFHHPVYWYKDGMVRQWTNAVSGGSSDEALSSSEIQDIWDDVMGGVTLISFTINGTTYQAEEGMTWYAWVSSAYNTGGFYSDPTTYPDNSYARAQNGQTISYNNVSEKSLNVIVNERAYTYNANGGGLND